MPNQNPARTLTPSTTCSTCQRRPADGTWNGRALDRLAPRTIDPNKSASTQPYRTTTAAQLAARQLRDEPVTPHPPTALIRIYGSDGRTTTLHPMRDVLSHRTIATLAAIEEGGRQ